MKKEKQYYHPGKAKFIKLDRARMIKFNIIGDHEFYLHKSIGDTFQKWTITDSRSGAFVCKAITQKEVIEKAEEILNKIGLEKFHKTSIDTLEAIEAGRV